jgi:hypothetical protein
MLLSPSAFLTPQVRLVADGYGLDRDSRAELVAAMDDAMDRIEVAALRSVDEGERRRLPCWPRPEASSSATGDANGGCAARTALPARESDLRRVSADCPE